MTCWSCVRCIKEWANGCWDANEMTWKNPCTTEWVNWWTNESTNQGINEPVSQWLRESLKQRSNDSMNQATMNQWIDESVNQRLNEPMVARFRESMNHWISWISEPRKQWINEWSNSVKFIVQQRSDPFSFCDFSAQSKLVWNAHVALATVWCTFCRPHLPKVLHACQFCNILKWKSSTCYSPGRFLSTTFADRTPQLRKQRPYCDDHRSHFTTKNAGFHAPRVFAPENSHATKLLHLPTTWWRVVDMMVGMLTMTRT